MTFQVSASLVSWAFTPRWACGVKLSIAQSDPDDSLRGLAEQGGSVRSKVAPTILGFVTSAGLRKVESNLGHKLHATEVLRTAGLMVLQRREQLFFTLCEILRVLELGRSHICKKGLQPVEVVPRRTHVFLFDLLSFFVV